APAPLPRPRAPPRPPRRPRLSKAPIRRGLADAGPGNPLDRPCQRLYHGRHVVAVGMDDAAVAGPDRHVPLPEDQVAAAEVRRRDLPAQRLLLVGVARAGLAAGE